MALYKTTVYSNRIVTYFITVCIVKLCRVDLTRLPTYTTVHKHFTVLLQPMVTSACHGYPTAAPMPMVSSTISKLSFTSITVSFTIGMDTVTSLSPRKTVTLIRVLSKSLPKIVSECTKIFDAY